MSATKRQARDRFREAVFARDGFHCRACWRIGCKIDAHHITPRKEMIAGGHDEYAVENGITLCDVPNGCHVEAEKHINDEGTDKWTRTWLRALLP